MIPPENRVKFDKTINLGHVLTAFSFLMVALAQWSIMDKRVVILEEFRLSQREKDSVQDAQSKEKFQEIKDALGDLRRSVEKVADKVGAK
jgi:hypothetical protein